MLLSSLKIIALLVKNKRALYLNRRFISAVVAPGHDRHNESVCFSRR